MIFSCFSSMRYTIPVLMLVSSACTHLPTAPSNTTTLKDVVAKKNNDIRNKTAQVMASHTPTNISLDLSSRHEKTLSNGLRVIVKEDHRAPVVMTQVWYKVGSTDDPEGKGGISHLLEHMMFKGTKKVTGDDFNRIVGRFGGQQNAFTSYDYTGYYQYYPAKRLALALELEADRMQNLVLNQQDFEKERQVVMEERRQRTDDNPRALAYEQFRFLAFSEAAQRQPVIGKMSDIESITLTDLKDWYEKWYSPNNATLVIVGDVSAPEAFAQVEKYFNKMTTKTLPERVSVKEPQQQGNRHQLIESSVPVPTMYLSFNVPSLTTSLSDTESKHDAYAIALLADVLDGGLSARLEKKLVREQKLLSSVGTSYDLFTRGDGLFFISATPTKGNTLEAVKSAIIAEINALKTQPISSAEIARAKTNYVTSILYQQDSVSSQARTIGAMSTVGLNDEILADFPEKIGEISEEKLQATAKKYFTNANMTSFFVIPEKKDSVVQPNVEETTSAPKSTVKQKNTP